MRRFLSKTRWCSIMSGNTINNISNYLLDILSPIFKEKINLSNSIEESIQSMNNYQNNICLIRY